MRLILALFLVLPLMGNIALAQGENPLAAFEPLIGTWSGRSIVTGTVSFSSLRFEWILGGAAVQQTESFDQGVNGGVTIYFWDPRADDGAGAIIYEYFSVRGVRSAGTAWWEDGQLFTDGDYTGPIPAITRFRGYRFQREDGSWLGRRDAVLAGRWSRGTDFLYEADPDAEFHFRDY